MIERHLEARVRRTPAGAVVDLSGEIDSFAEETLNAAYAEAEGAEEVVARATDQGAEAILLNFEDVQYINSTGIALIVGLLARARASRRRLLAYGLSDHYVEIFNITRLSDFMSVCPNEESALEQASEKAET